jgi:hypothetical protein
MRWLVCSLLAAVTPLGVAGVTSAQIGERQATIAPRPIDAALTEGVVSSPVLWLIVLGLAVSLIAASRARRTAVSFLIMLLACLAFESSVHSVHHLGEPREAVRCIVELVSSNLSCLADDASSTHGATQRTDVAPNLEPLAPAQHPLRPQGGRAPPFPT